MPEWLDTMQILLLIEIWKIRGLKARNLLSSRDGKGVRLLNKEKKKEKKKSLKFENLKSLSGAKGDMSYKVRWKMDCPSEKGFPPIEELLRLFHSQTPKNELLWRKPKRIRERAKYLAGIRRPDWFYSTTKKLEIKFHHPVMWMRILHGI